MFTDATTAVAELPAALRELEELEKRISKLTSQLPPLPDDADEATFVEIGYSRFETVTVDTDENGVRDGRAYSGGWDSMTEGGAAAWLEYDGEMYAVPDDMEWD